MLGNGCKRSKRFSYLLFRKVSCSKVSQIVNFSKEYGNKSFNFSLWKIIGLDFCHLNEISVKLLLHSLIYDSGKNAFWSIVERDFNSSNWKIRMQAS